LAELFRFGPLHADDLVLAVGAALGVLIVLETVKPLFAAPARGRTG
jgi:Ca2+-transporting ATPase